MEAEVEGGTSRVDGVDCTVDNATLADFEAGGGDDGETGGIEMVWTRDKVLLRERGDAYDTDVVAVLEDDADAGDETEYCGEGEREAAAVAEVIGDGGSSEDAGISGSS